MGQQISTTFPDSTYTSANKPSVETLKADISAIETAVNANQTAAVETTDTDVSSNSWVLDEDAMGSDSNQKVPTQQSVKAYVDAQITAAKAALYPVGSYYINETNSTNPATLLGFGTWTAVQDRMIIGHGSTYTAGATGGSATKTIAQANLPDVDFDVTDPGHGHNTSYTTDGENDPVGGNHNICTDYRSPSGTGDKITVVSNTTGISVNSGGSGTAMDVLNPYIGAYIWKRTG